MKTLQYGLIFPPDIKNQNSSIHQCQLPDTRKKLFEKNITEGCLFRCAECKMVWKTRHNQFYTEGPYMWNLPKSERGPFSWHVSDIDEWIKAGGSI